jgi:hypothetical protein
MERSLLGRCATAGDPGVDTADRHLERPEVP